MTLRPMVIGTVGLVLAALAVRAVSMRGEDPGAGMTVPDSAGVAANVDSLPVQRCPETPATQRCQLLSEVGRLHKGFEIWAYSWGFLYHACLFLGIIFTGVAGYLAKVENGGQADVALAKKSSDRRRTWAAILALVAALLTSLNAAGGFNGKWKANRDARSRLDVVRVNLQDPSVTLSQVRDSLRVIIKEQNGAISAASSQ